MCGGDGAIEAEQERRRKISEAQLRPGVVTAKKNRMLAAWQDPVYRTAMLRKMSRLRIDRTGQRFGRLVVLKYTGKIGRSLAKWLCRCDCGKTPVVLGEYLRSGHTKSCGCLKRDWGIARGVLNRKSGTAFRLVFNAYTASAKKKHREFWLTEDLFRQLTSSNCFYCGDPPSLERRSKNGIDCYTYNGIDRLDNDKGYKVANCVPCCWPCNRLKGKRNHSEFIALIQRIAKYRWGTISANQGELKCA